MKVSLEPQRSAAWFELRRGMPTCSRFDSILTPKTGKPASAQESLINELIAESLQPPEQGFIKEVITTEMEHGIIMEAEARCSFELEYANGPVSEVGFIVHDSGLFGGSPDALVGDNSGVEIKCPNLATHIGYMRDGGLPGKYKCQVHGCMIVTGRDEWNFYSYARNAEPFHVVVVRDEFTDALEAELYRFCEKYNEVREKFGLKKIGGIQL